MGSVTPYETAAGRRYRVRYRKPDHSQTDKRGFKTKREAELYLAGVEVNKARGEWLDPSLARTTIAEWAPTWLASHPNLKPTTSSAYEWTLKKHILPRWSRTPLVAVEHTNVQSWINDLSKDLAPSSVRKIHVIFSGLMKYAVRANRITRNPCDDVRLPRILASDRGYLTHQQVDELATLCGGTGDIVTFLAYTGLRWGEMAALKVKRIDLTRRRVDVAEAITEPRGTIIWGTPKNHETRSVPFPAFLAPMLRERCEGKGRDDLVFPAPRGDVFRSGGFRKRTFDPAVAKLRENHPDLPKITPHSLRHTAASLAVSAGANVKSVQRMLGHASAAMTLDVYSDLFDDDLDAVAIALDEGARRTIVGKTWADDPSQEEADGPRSL